MARKPRTSPLADFTKAISMLPWWVGALLAVVSFIVLHQVAGMEIAASRNLHDISSTLGSHIFKTAASILQFFVPVVFLIGAAMSGWAQFQSPTVLNVDRFGQDPWMSAPVGESRDEPRFHSDGPRISDAALDPGKWSLELIKAMEWLRLEELSAAYFTQLGFRSQLGAGGADGGVDIHLYADGAATPGIIVQCKAWRSQQVGVKELREFFGVMTSEKVPEGVFITNSIFSVDAKAFCTDKNIHLIDGPDLLAKIKQLTDAQQQSLLALATKGDFLTPSCPSCRIKMLYREGKEQGKGFWGCANFPRCRNKMYAAKGA